MSRADRSRNERSAEDRERDRAERERRRAQREGLEPAAPALPEPLEPAVPAEPAADVAPEPEPEPEPPPQPPPVPEPEPEDLPHPPEPVQVDPVQPDVEPELEPLPPAAPEPQVPRAPEPAPPAGRRTGRRERTRSAAVSIPAAGEPRRRRGPARLLALVALVAVAAAVVLVVHALGKTSTARTAPPPVVVRIVIPEGKTRAQIAELAKAEGLTGSYRLASRSSPSLSPAHYGAPAGTPDLEGFLFPATYELYAHASARQLVEEQLTAFQEHFGSDEEAAAKALGLTPYQLLIVASLVEREAQVPGDRPKIAAVIYNRLREGMPIGIDASIYYAVELRRNISTYTGELTEADLHIDSPYNTRTHTGLPPTPISNPGAASIAAAAHPSKVPYLYYVAGADGCGEQVFSTTQAAFEANVAAYDSAVQANGGHPPTCKKK